jgi:hypothetical protein
MGVGWSRVQMVEPTLGTICQETPVGLILTKSRSLSLKFSPKIELDDFGPSVPLWFDSEMNRALGYISAETSSALRPLTCIYLHMHVNAGGWGSSAKAVVD